MPCVRGANVSSSNLDSWPSERYAFWQSLGWCRRSEPSAVCFCTTPGDRRTSSSEIGRVVLGLSFSTAGRHAPALQASRKSKHLLPAVVVLGRYTCDTGRVTLWGGGGKGGIEGSVPPPACLEERGLQKKKTSAHFWPHALENRQIYQTKGIESSGLFWSGMLGRCCCQVREGPASCSWTPALCTMRRPSRRVTMCRLTKRGRVTGRVSDRVRFPQQVSGAQAKATVCRT